MSPRDYLLFYHSFLIQNFKKKQRRSRAANRVRFTVHSTVKVFSQVKLPGGKKKENQNPRDLCWRHQLLTLHYSPGHLLCKRPQLQHDGSSKRNLMENMEERWGLCWSSHCCSEVSGGHIQWLSCKTQDSQNNDKISDIWKWVWINGTM